MDGFGMYDQGMGMTDPNMIGMNQGVPMMEQGMPIGQGMPMMQQGMPMVGQGMPMMQQGIPMVQQSMPMIQQGMPMMNQDMYAGQGMPMMGQNYMGMPQIKYSRAQMLQGLRDFIVNNSQVYISREEKIEETPNVLRHACAKAGVSGLKINNFPVPEMGINIPFYFCTACGKLYYYKDFYL